MKITDLLVSAIIKKGILYEARNVDLDIDIPFTQQLLEGLSQENKIKVNIKAEHMSLKIERE